MKATRRLVRHYFGQRILGFSRRRKRLLVFLLDFSLCLGTTFLAFYLRTGEWAWPADRQWLAFGLAILFSVPLFITSGLYRAIFRYADWPALVAVARACGLYAILYSTVFTFLGIASVPRTLGLIQPILLFLAIVASRGLARFWLGGNLNAMMRRGDKKRVVIYGAGSAGRQLASALATDPLMRVVAFIDDDLTLQKSVLNGLTIHGSHDLKGVFDDLNVTDVLLAIPSTSRVRRSEVIEAVRTCGVAVRTLPGMADIASGRVTTSDLRELDIEDLLGRDTVPPNLILLGKNITGKTVMVTGAGGSIGSELCRQIMNLRPSTLLLVEQSEFNLYAIEQELSGRGGEEAKALVPVLGSVEDADRMDHVLSVWKPDTIYHAAAYKHVPIVEQNPAEGVRNNVFGTQTVAQLAQKHGVQDFVLISTDKAVRPTNVMGASKRLAEMVLQALAAEGSATRYSMVRFGNVLGSSGSVVPLFRSQINSGGPITVTHPEITRYFMTIPEAALLVIQAGAMGSGGEVFVLDMGEPVKIVDLARRMIELSGLTVRDEANPNGDVAIDVIGLRPGEKLYEELLIGDDPQPTQHKRIMKARDEFVRWKELSLVLEAMRHNISINDSAALRAILVEAVHGFKPDNAGVDLTARVKV